MKPILGGWYVFCAGFILYPIVTVVGRSLMVNGQFDLGHFQNICLQTRFLKITGGTLVVSCGSATISTLIGAILAVTIFKTALPFRKLFTIAAVLPIILPGFITSLAYIFLFGRNGLVTYQWLGISWNVYSWRSVLFLQSFGLITTTFFIISATLADLDGRVEDAARNLGAGEWKVLTSVVLPLIRPGLISAWLLAFMRAMADFSTPYIVGGRFTTLATASYTQLIGVYNTGMAAALNTVLLLLCLTVFTAYTCLQRKFERIRIQRSEVQGRPIRLHPTVNSLLVLICSVFALMVGVFLVSVVLAAFMRHLGGDFTLTVDHFKILPQHGWISVRNSLVFAAVTSLLMSFFSLIAAYMITRFPFYGRRLLDGMLTLPFAVPGTFIGLGFALAFNRSGFLWMGTWTIIIACTVVRELPVGLRAGMNILASQDRGVEMASANLGASGAATFWGIVIPLARPALLVAALYAFITTLKTLGAVIFIMTPGTKVLAVDVFEATVRGDTGNAAALSFLLMLVAAGGLFLIYLIGKKNGVLTWFQKTPNFRN